MVAWVTGVPWVEEIDVVDRGPQDTPADPTKYAPTAPPAVKSETCGQLSRLLTAVVAGENTQLRSAGSPSLADVRFMSDSAPP